MRFLKLETITISHHLIAMNAYPHEVHETDEADLATLEEWFIQNGYGSGEAIEFRIIGNNHPEKGLCDVLKVLSGVVRVDIHAEFNQLSDKDIEQMLVHKDDSPFLTDYNFWITQPYGGDEVGYLQSYNVNSPSMGTIDSAFQTRNFYKALYWLLKTRENLPDESEQFGITAEESHIDHCDC